jgi:hypothetical protein
VAIPKGFTAREDDVGQMHAIPPGKILKIGKNGSEIADCPAENASENKFIITFDRRDSKKEPRGLPCLKLLDQSDSTQKSEVVRIYFFPKFRSYSIKEINSSRGLRGEHN